jgi:hypothetical protein
MADEPNGDSPATPKRLALPAVVPPVVRRRTHLATLHWLFARGAALSGAVLRKRVLLGALLAVASGAACCFGAILTFAMVSADIVLRPSGLQQTLALLSGGVAGLLAAALVAWVFIWAPRDRPLRKVVGVTGVLLVAGLAGYISFWSTCLGAVFGLDAVGSSQGIERAINIGTALGTASGIVAAVAVATRLLTRK